MVDAIKRWWIIFCITSAFFPYSKESVITQKQHVSDDSDDMINRAVQVLNSLMSSMENKTMNAETCFPNPCQNNGTCKVDGQRIYCHCKFPFQGEFCENDCDCGKNAHPCEVDEKSKSITCECFEGFIWKGEECELCTCSDENAYCSFTEDGEKQCLCNPGHIKYGNTCKSCYCGGNGKCVFEGGNPKCICDKGFQEINGNCERHCTDQFYCQNGGKCRNVGNKFFCDCPPNFKGEKCEVDLCASLHESCRAMGAICQFNGFISTCECPPGQVYQRTTGICEDICDSTKCVHGDCEVSGRRYICKCNEGFIGSRCSVKIDSVQIFPGVTIAVMALCIAFVTLMCGTCIFVCSRRRKTP